MGAVASGRGAIRRSSALLGWAVLRASGVAMLALALGHLFVMHYLRAPAETSADFVAERWSNALWLGFDWLLLVAALLHGSVGVQAVLTDVVRPRRARALAGRVVVAAGVLFAAVGTAAILAYDPSRAAGARGPLSGQAWLAETLAGLLFGLATLTYLGVLGVAVRGLWRLGRREPLGLWSLPGHWAWALHRLTGLGIYGFLLLHVLDVALLPLAPEVYDQTVRAYAVPYLLPMEVALVVAVLFHALNGARLMVLEVWEVAPRTRQNALIYGVALLTLALVLPSVAVLLRARG